MDIHLPRLPYSEDKLFGILFLIVFAIPLAFDIYNYEAYETIKYGLFLILVGVGLIMLYSKFKDRVLEFAWSKLFLWALGLFWFWALLSTLFAWDKNYAFFGFYARFTSGFLFYSLWSLFILLLGLINSGQAKFLLKVLVFAAGLIAVWGLLQSIGFGYYTGPVTDFFNRGAPSFLGNVDFSSMFLAPAIILTLGCYLAAGSFKTKVYYAVSLFLQLWAIIIFASRGALLGFAVGFATVVFLALLSAKPGRKLLLASIFVAFLILGLNQIFLNLSRPGTLQAAASFTDVNVQDRLAIWKLSLESVAKRPLLGVGLGNFQLMFERDPQSEIISGGFFDDAHNLFLELAVTGGLPLLLFFLGLAGSGAWVAVGRLRRGFDMELVVVLGAIAAWLTASLFNPVVIPCYILLAVLIRQCFSVSPSKVNLPAGKATRLTLAVLGAVLAVYGLVFITAEHLFFASTQAYNANDYGRSYNLATAAVRLNPINRLYYIYEAGSAIRSGQPLDKINAIIGTLGRLNAGRSYSYVELANIQYLLYFRTHDPAYPSQIISNMNSAIKIDRFSSDNYFLLAEYEIIFGNLTGAAADMSRGLSLSPADFESTMFLAKIYQQENDRQDLEATLLHAHAIDPSRPEPLVLLHAVKQAADIKAVPFNVDFSLGRLD